MGIQLPIMDGYEVTRQINRVTIDSDHRRHLLCAQRGGKEGAGGWMR